MLAPGVCVGDFDRGDVGEGDSLRVDVEVVGEFVVHVRRVLEVEDKSNADGFAFELDEGDAEVTIVEVNRQNKGLGETFDVLDDARVDSEAVEFGGGENRVVGGELGGGSRRHCESV